MSKPVKLKVTNTVAVIYREGNNALLDMDAVRVEVCDDGGGRFLEITQGGETIKLDPDELQKVAEVGSRMVTGA